MGIHSAKYRPVYGAVVYLSEKEETSTENTSGAFAGAAQPRQRRRVPSAAHQTDEEHHPKLCGEGTCAKKSTRVNSEEQNPQFWLDKAKAELELALKLQNRKKKVAKNVILFLGDGMATASITASRILKGEKEKKLGAEAVLSMDLSDYMGFSKTYNVDSQVADSAGTATAYLTGVKTDLGVVGLTAAVTPGVCNTSVEVEVQSILMDSVA